VREEESSATATGCTQHPLFVREEDECAEVPVVPFEGIDDGGVRRAEIRTSVAATVPVIKETSLGRFAVEQRGSRAAACDFRDAGAALP
jgi:hypothetical protein